MIRRLCFLASCCAAHRPCDIYIYTPPPLPKCASPECRWVYLFFWRFASVPVGVFAVARSENEGEGEGVLEGEGGGWERERKCENERVRNRVQGRKGGVPAGVSDESS
jgi:hypothetical protein